MIFSIVSGDYIMAPALCVPENIDGFVEDLLRLKWVMDNEIYPVVVLEDDILLNSYERGFFPCSKVFKENIAKSSEPTTYSSQDIVTIVHSLLEGATEISKFCGVSGIVLGTEFIHEIISQCPLEERKKELINLLTCTAFYSVYDKNKNGALLHFVPERGVIPSTLRFGISLAQVGDSLIEDFDVEYNDDVFGSYDALLIRFGSEKLISFIKCDFSLKLAIYVKTMELANEIGGYIHWDSFDIGSSLLESMRVNQCMYGGKFSANVFESISRVLLHKPKYEVKVFYKSNSKTEARFFEDFKAFRTHISKGSEALRLMFGIDSKNFIRITNVGVKQELEILW